MAVYEVFARPEQVRYLASWWSKATLVQIILICLMWIAPLLIVVSSGGFWPKTSMYNEQPNVQFKYQLLVTMETASTAGASYVTWSTYNNYNQLQMSNVRIPNLSVRENDFNGDGLYDQLDFELSMPLPDDQEVRSVQLMLIFDYVLQTYSYFQMESMAYIAFASPSPGAGLTVSGNLALMQTTPLGNSGTDLTYNVPVISNTSIYAQAYSLPVILTAYSARNQTTRLDGAYPVWLLNRGAGQPFVIKALINYSTQFGIRYYTGFWEMIKWGWVQYVCVLIIFWFVFYRIKVFIFQHQLVSTIVIRSGEKTKPL